MEDRCDQDRSNCAHRCRRCYRRGIGANILFRRRSRSVPRPAALLCPLTLRPLSLLCPVPLLCTRALRPAARRVLRWTAGLSERSHVLSRGPLQNLERLPSGLDGAGRPVQAVSRILAAPLAGSPHSRLRGNEGGGTVSPVRPRESGDPEVAVCGPGFPLARE